MVEDGGDSAESRMRRLLTAVSLNSAKKTYESNMPVDCIWHDSALSLPMVLLKNSVTDGRHRLPQVHKLPCTAVKCAGIAVQWTVALWHFMNPPKSAEKSFDRGHRVDPSHFTLLLLPGIHSEPTRLVYKLYR